MSRACHRQGSFRRVVNDDPDAARLEYHHQASGSRGLNSFAVTNSDVSFQLNSSSKLYPPNQDSGQQKKPQPAPLFSSDAFFGTQNQHPEPLYYRPFSSSSRTNPIGDKKLPPKPGIKSIEIMPGYSARLRGADETWECILNDFYVPAACLGCTEELCCIEDADFVLCPSCRVVSPMTGVGRPKICDDDILSVDREGGGGVGIGFTLNNLRSWQTDIVMARNRRQGEMEYRREAARGA